MMGSRRCSVLTAVLFLFAATMLVVPVEAAEPKPVGKRVRLVVNYGDGCEKHFTAIPWREGMTVLDALTHAQKHRRGIRIVYRGKGATAFLTKIDDLENEGRGRNWIFRINDELADRSFAVEKVKPSDTILWEFGKYR